MDNSNRECVLNEDINGGSCYLAVLAIVPGLAATKIIITKKKQ